MAEMFLFESKSAAYQLQTCWSSGYAVGRGFVEFFGNGMGKDFVKWRDQDSAAIMWLILISARTIMLLGVHTCLWNMVYEWYCEPTARFARNPYYIYDAEKALIRHLLNYVLLVGLSMWFFNSSHFKFLSLYARCALLSIAFCTALLTVCYTLRVIEYLMFKERPKGRREISWFLYIFVISPFCLWREWLKLIN